MKHRRVLTIALTIVLSFFVLVFGAIVWIESDSGRHWLERKASDLTGREISIGKIQVKLGWRPGFRVSGLRIRNPDWRLITPARPMKPRAARSHMPCRSSVLAYISEAPLARATSGL